QHYQYLKSEIQINRNEIVDHRVHCCLYFIAPTGRRLKKIDIEFMRHLHGKVNIIPVIGKADTMTPDELTRFKENVGDRTLPRCFLHTLLFPQIMSDIKQHGINIYHFPDSIGSGSEDEEHFRNLKSRIPFAVVASNHVYEEKGKRK